MKKENGIYKYTEGGKDIEAFILGEKGISILPEWYKDAENVMAEVGCCVVVVENDNKPMRMAWGDYVYFDGHVVRGMRKEEFEKRRIV